MAGHALIFSKPFYLRLSLGQLVIIDTKEDHELRRIPVEDLDFVVLDHPQVKCSAGLIQELASNDVVVIYCDEKHMPHSQLLPFTGNHIFQQRLRLQLDATKPQRKALWQQVIKCKIANQAAVISAFGGNAQPYLRGSRNVKSGDTGNEEAKAASRYFKELFGSGFRRVRFGDAPNNFLNYGYTILRATVARSLVASGLHPALGLHHKNKYNAFCLADDVMEPYRKRSGNYLL